MVRAPCCAKMGLKKGPWTTEEDHILIAHIHKYGHSNWRALPKQAGLLRCGKSCRLRWTNYLRPDIKRGNFTQEEEETIIKLHERMGNRWSAIAAKLPGRTDNEIKNVWHTHLKKRLKQNQTTTDTKQQSSIQSEPGNFPSHNPIMENSGNSPESESSSDVSFSSTDYTSIMGSENNSRDNIDEVIDSLPEFDEDFWSETLSMEFSGTPENFPADPLLQLQFSPVSISEFTEPILDYSSNMGEGTDFWYNLFINAGELPHWPEF